MAIFLIVFPLGSILITFRIILRKTYVPNCVDEDYFEDLYYTVNDLDNLIASVNDDDKLYYRAWW